MSRALTAVALIAAYNEADIIEPVVRDLIANGLLVYFLDDGSTDATASLVEPFVGQGVIAVERIESPDATGNSRQFAWERLLRRKAQLAAEIDADWFIHHDADEFRESPWAGVSLLDGIRRVDALGYNAVDFASLDFWPTHDGFTPGTDPRDAFPLYSEAASYDRVQVRCWRKASNIDLASSGGHDVQFDNRRVFPIRFISRHYPIRGQAHGERKIFTERRPRFSPKERERNWHVQYDAVDEGASFIRDACELIRYDGDAVRMSLALRHRDVEALETFVAELKATLDSSREEIARRAGQISELNGVVEGGHRDLAAQREDSLLLRATLDSRAMELCEARAQLAHVNNELRARDIELGNAHTELAGLQQAAEARARENDALREDVSQLRAATEQQASILARARTQVDNRDRQLAAQTLEVLSTRAALKEARGGLEAFQQSWSWRVTAPARVLLRVIRGY